ncbi:MAG: D-alanine--D-alanine ligase [Halieaceae bacterium]
MSSTVLRDHYFGVLLGGSAAERDISLKSGRTVGRNLEAAGARVAFVDPAEDGWQEKLQGVEFVFNLLHGPGGEDGTLQGMLEMMKLPYSGSGVLGSALTMDKVKTKLVWQGLGLPTPAFVALSEETEWSAVMDELGDAFVKPALEGSSIGMTRAKTPKELESAFKEARRFGAHVLAEQYVEGDEYTVAVLGDRALPVIRIQPAAGFYDFNAKYISDETQFFCPSGLTDQEEGALAELALQAFSVVGAQVWGRVDVMRKNSGDWQLLEVNTIPGMTSHSLVPMAAQAADMSMERLLSDIWQLSLEVRHGP